MRHQVKYFFLAIMALVLMGAVYRITEDVLKIGDGDDVDKEIVMDVGDGSTNPAIKYNATDNRFEFSNDGTNYKTFGSGAGGIVSLLEEPDFEDGSIGAAITYANAASYKPTDGSTGTADTISVAINGSTPILGENSLRISHDDAEDGQGEGVAIPFTMPLALKAQPLSISFFYKASTDFSYGDASDPTVSPSDLTIFIIDDDANEVIEPSTFFLFGSDTYVGKWQSNATSTNYRIVFHCATANTDDWTFDIDHLVIGSENKAIGPPRTDWKAADTEIVLKYGATTATNISLYSTTISRDGDSADIRAVVRFSGAANANGDMAFTLPNNITMDTERMPAAGKMQGYASFYTNTKRYTGQIRPGDTDDVFEIIRWDDSGANNDEWAGNTTAGSNIPSGAAIANNDLIEINIFDLPVVGWSSNTVLSSEGSARGVVAIGYLSGNESFGASPARIGNTSLLTIEKDTHGALATNGVFTAPVSGYYDISGTGFFEGHTDFNGTTENWVLRMYINTAASEYLQSFFPLSQVQNYTKPFTATRYLNAGDTVDIRASQTSGVNHNMLATYTRLIFARRADPSTIASGEVVAMHAQINNGAVTTCTDTPTTQDFNLVDYDTHNMTTTGASWKWTAPIMGFYHISLGYQLAANTYAVNNQLIVNLQKNGTTEIIMRDRADTTSSTQLFVMGSADIKMEAGDYISVQAKHDDTGIAVNIDDGDNRRNWISIHRIGGVM